MFVNFFRSFCVVLVAMPSRRLWLLYSFHIHRVHLSHIRSPLSALTLLSISFFRALRLIVVCFSCLTIRLAPCVCICEHAPFFFNSSHLFRLNTLQISGKDFCPFNRCFRDRIGKSIVVGWLLLHAHSDVLDSAKVNSNRIESVEWFALVVPWSAGERGVRVLDALFGMHPIYVFRSKSFIWQR